jgi:hypothetical protein
MLDFVDICLNYDPEQDKPLEEESYAKVELDEVMDHIFSGENQLKSGQFSEFHYPLDEMKSKAPQIDEPIRFLVPCRDTEGRLTTILSQPDS